MFGGSWWVRLMRCRINNGNAYHFSDLIDSLQSLRQMTRQVTRLKKLGDDRSYKLHISRKIWLCIEEFTKV